VDRAIGVTTGGARILAGYLNRRAFDVGTDINFLSDTHWGGATDLDREIGSNLSRSARKGLADLPERQAATLELFLFRRLDLAEIRRHS